MSTSIAVERVQYLGPAARCAGDGWQVVGQDGGQSIHLADGRSLFFFSDTLLASEGPSGKRRGWFVGSCSAIASAECNTLHDAMAKLDYVLGDEGRPAEMLQPTLLERSAGYRFWPGHGIQMEKTIVLFYVGIRHHTPGTWGFDEEGVGLATYSLLDGKCVRILRKGDWRPWPGLPSRSHCGVQILRDRPWAYVFCSVSKGLDSHAFLARVSEMRADEPDAYEFYSGNSDWSRDFLRAQPITQAAAEYSVAFNHYLDCYVMAYLDAHSKQLLLRTAKAPWGPYGQPLVAGVVPHAVEGKMVSLGFQHSQFDEEDGRVIYLSYSQPLFHQNGLLKLKFR